MVAKNDAVDLEQAGNRDLEVLFAAELSETARLDSRGELR
jgi:hypothetical protein